MADEPSRESQWETVILLTRLVKHCAFATRTGQPDDWAKTLSLNEIDKKLGELGAYDDFGLGEFDDASNIVGRLEDYTSAAGDCYHVIDLFDPNNFGGLDKIFALKAAWHFGQHSLYILRERMLGILDAVIRNGGNSIEMKGITSEFARATKFIGKKRGEHTHESDVQPLEIRRIERLWTTVSGLKHIQQHDFDTVLDKSANTLKCEYLLDFRRVHDAVEVAMTSQAMSDAGDVTPVSHPAITRVLW